MNLSATLRRRIVEFLTNLPNIHDNHGQQAFLQSAGIDEKLLGQLSVGTPPKQFVELLVSTCVKYGSLCDGRHALEAILETAKDYIGTDKRAQCDCLLKGLYKFCQEYESPNDKKIYKHQNKPLVFISHSSADKDKARLFAEGLRARNVDVWIDEEQVRFGDSIPRKISEGLDASDALIVLVSRSFVESSWCRDEYEPILSKEIKERHVYVIAVILDDVAVPSLISAKRYVDLIDDQQLQQLCDDIWDGYSIKLASQITEDLTIDSFGIRQRGMLFDLIVPKIVSELSVAHLADETLGPGKSLIDLYRAVDHLIDRFQELIDRVSRVMIRCGGKDGYFPYYATPEELHEVTIANRKLLSIARDMRDISMSVQELLPPDSELGERLRLISQLCVNISEDEGNICLKFGFPPDVPYEDKLYDYTQQPIRWFVYHEVAGMPTNSGGMWTEEDDKNVAILDHYRHELRQAIAAAVSENSAETT